MFNTASEVNGGEYVESLDTQHCGMSVKLQLLVGSWDIHPQVKYWTVIIIILLNNNDRKIYRICVCKS